MNKLISIVFCVVAASFFMQCSSNQKKRSMDYDIINAYNLKIGKTHLFGNINSLIEEFGLPKYMSDKNQEKKFKSSEDVINILKGSIDFTVVNYPGIVFWCFNDLEAIPSEIDFRKLDNEITYGEIVFNKEYTLDSFKNNFPSSYLCKPDQSLAFFGVATHEKIEGLEHFFVERHTKTDPTVKQLVEFTFEEEKLIYILFVNF